MYLGLQALNRSVQQASFSQVNMKKMSTAKLKFARYYELNICVSPKSQPLKC